MARYRVAVLAGPAILIWLRGSFLSSNSGDSPAPPRGDKLSVANVYATVPLGFEPNRGQSGRDVRFLSRGACYGVFLARDEIVLALGEPGSAKSAVLRMGLVGADRNVPPKGLDRLAGSVNYLRGADRQRWRSATGTYRRVEYEGVYPGIDLVLHGDQRALEYDFVVAPGADARRVGITFDGADRVALTKRGELSISTAAGTVRQSRSRMYQEVDGVRRPVDGAFRIDRGTIGFRIGSYDRARPLVIDLVIEYSTFLGGATGYDSAVGLAVDSEGAAYVAGRTFSADFPTTAGGIDRTRGGSATCAPAQDPNFTRRLPAGACPMRSWPS